MKFYLSSYKLGDYVEDLKSLIPRGTIFYIPNALDFSWADQEKKKIHIDKDIDSLTGLGINVILLDLSLYFGKRNELFKILDEVQAVFISGGNTFVLRQAMMLSGFDEFLLKYRDHKNFLYAGYSAAGAVLAPNLKCYEIVDKPDTPYKECNEVIWEGLALLNYAIMPHYKSDHPETSAIDQEIEYCIANSIPFRTISDGEVIII